MRKIQYSLLMIIPAAGKFALILLLLKLDKTQEAFANLYIIEAIAILVFSLTYCSYDTFITRYWLDVQQNWVCISVQHMLKNGFLGTFVIIILLF